MTSSFASALGLVLIPFFAALRGMGVAELVLAVAFASPALLVALHARRRSRAR